MVDFYPCHYQDSTSNVDFNASLTCIGKRPPQSVIDWYVTLQKSVGNASVESFVYDNTIATGGILRLLVSKNDPKGNYRILFDRKVTFMLGTSLENCDMEMFLQNGNVRVAFDEDKMLDSLDPAVVRALDLMQSAVGNFSFFNAEVVFIGNHVSENLNKAPVCFI